MSRSSFKNNFNTISFLKNLDKKNIITIRNRNAIILKEYIGLEFLVYNGKINMPLLITSNMVGFRFGEFVFTRAKYNNKK